MYNSINCDRLIWCFFFEWKFESRHLLFFLVEKSPGDWTEENIGEKFLLLMRWTFHQILFLRQNSWKYSSSAIAEVAKFVYFSNIFNWNPPFRMLKQHLMKQKMPHFFIRWILYSLKGEYVNTIGTLLCIGSIWIRFNFIDLLFFSCPSTKLVKVIKILF